MSRLDVLSNSASEALKEQGFESSRIRTERYLNMRFDGTDNALMVTAPSADDGSGIQDETDFETAFKRSYKREFGFLLENKAVIVDDIKVRGIGKTFDVALINPKASFEQAGLPIAAAIDADKKSGWAIDPQFGKDHAAVFEIGADLVPDGGATLILTLDFQGNTGHSFGRFRFSATGSPRPVGLDGNGIPANVAPILETPRAKRSAEQTAALLAW